jgi:hypothetical protein
MEHRNALDILLPKLANSASLAARQGGENASMPVTIVLTAIVVRLMYLTNLRGASNCRGSIAKIDDRVWHSLVTRAVSIAGDFEISNAASKGGFAVCAAALAFEQYAKKASLPPSY